MNNSKIVHLHTKVCRIDAEGNKNDIEFFVEGSYTEKEAAKYITYKETAVSGMEGTTTTLKIEINRLSIIRFGTYNSKLTFQQGQQTETSYQTPYGTLPIAINTTKLELELNPQGESIIKLHYSLDTGEEQALTNEVWMSYK